MNTQSLQHLISIEQLEPATLNYLLNQAQSYVDSALKTHSILPKWNGKIVTHLFFENSTRTRNSFEIATKRLGALCLSPDLDSSSLKKGEGLVDMLLTLEAMGTDIFVIRHSQNGIMEEIVPYLQPHTHLINAGDGSHQHPTQALLDLLTIKQLKNGFLGLKVAIVGDIKHSRVARSLVHGLELMGVDDIRLVAPDYLLSTEAFPLSAKKFTSLDQGLKGVDIIYCLRLQTERMDANFREKVANYSENYLINNASLQFASPQAIVMHPAPINREVEISSEIVESPRSAILKQVSNGVAVRMAVIDYLLAKK